MKPNAHMQGGHAGSAGLPIEIAGAVDQLAVGDLIYALHRARFVGAGADEVLLASGTLGADALAQAAARHLGVAFAPLTGDVPASAMPRPTYADLVALLRTGLMRRTDGKLVVAARGEKLRGLATRLAATWPASIWPAPTWPHLHSSILLTTPERLGAYVRRRFGGVLAERAAFGLRRMQPRASAGTLGASRFIFATFALLLMLIPILLSEAPGPLAVTLAVVVSVVLLGWTILRLGACLGSPIEVARAPLRDDRLLPAYSLIVALYHEARVVPQLVAALEAIDYPKEKLQVLLVIEADDPATAAALARHARHPCFEVITAPDIGPRTKPKALNVALPFVRGAYVGIFDAEDIPDPDQLRRACAVFRSRAGREIGCVQARLAIDNVDDGWITRQFAAEYAGHFDVLLPMLGACRLPFPLGGTSNHFRREALDAAGGWDPYNVTEDADLGIRLARHGWRAAVIDSTTDEEAPRHWRAWLRQRTRWYKGWMQTLLVHGRHPRSLMRDAGPGGGAAFFLLVGGGVAAAMIHPFFLFTLAWNLMVGRPAPLETSAIAVEGVGLAVFLIGYSGAILCTALGMRRRRMAGLWRVLPLMPVYWLMMSLAAWRAVLQLVCAPQLWEKTDHGLARTSRRGRRRRVRLVRPTNSGADRRRPRTAGA